MNDQPVIKTTELHRIYEGAVDVHAVNDVNLEIKRGEFTAIIGPSGSGKTTLLNLISGLDKPTKGEVVVAGKHLHDMNESQLIDFRMNHIGFVFQSYNLLPVLTVRENTEFIMMLQKRPKKEREARVKQLLKEVDILEKIDNRPAELSGGQQQRVAVARALASKPDFILADEPTANLDTASAFNLLDIMANLNEQEQTTFIFSTHDQRVIDRAKRVITLEDGKIVNDEHRP